MGLKVLRFGTGVLWGEGTAVWNWSLVGLKVLRFGTGVL